MLKGDTNIHKEKNIPEIEFKKLCEFFEFLCEINSIAYSGFNIHKKKSVPDIRDALYNAITLFKRIFNWF
jgi:hypothetical protein